MDNPAGRLHSPGMKALILAAGRGERMRPLSDDTPKPLLRVRGKRLIEWHLEALARAGVREVVVNTAWLEEQFPAVLGDGSRYGLAIRYSMEGRDHGGALETAGGIAKALPWLGELFWVASADVFAPDFAFDGAAAQRFTQRSELLAHLWLVPNPDFHAAGDFGLDAEGHALSTGGDGRRWTYANFALMRAALCADLKPGTGAPLGPLLRAGMDQRRISAEIWSGEWHNLGTPQQLAAADGSEPNR